MFGRSPDHVASFVTGMAMKPDALPAPHAFADNLLKYYRHIRDNDTYVVYAVVPPQAARNPEFYQKKNIPVPTLRVVREDDDGVVISGMKMLATGALYANEIWIGNVIPLAPDQKKEAITCAIPCNAPGLTLWSRKPAAVGLTSEFDSPLAWRYDESDSMLMCDEVKVPWEKVFVHDDALLSRDIYIKTPSHCFGNHQSNVRYWSKMRLLLGLCSRIANATGADQVPAVREKLGEMSAIEATIGGMVNGQINAFESWPEGYVCFNRRFMYAGLEWCTQNYSRFIDELRTLCGGGVFQMPADISVMDDPELAKQFETYWQTPQADSHHPHEAVQARLGHGRLGVRRPASAIREVLRRRVVHHPQPFVSRDRLGRVQRARRQVDGGLRRAERRKESGGGVTAVIYFLPSMPIALFPSPEGGGWTRASASGRVGLVAQRRFPTRPRSAIASARPPSPKTGRDSQCAAATEASAYSSGMTGSST